MVDRLQKKLGVGFQVLATPASLAHGPAMFRRRFRTLVAPLLVLALQPFASADSVTVMAWNIEWFPGTRPRATWTEASRQMDGAKETLAKISPQILCAQELTDELAFTQLVEAVPGMKVDVFSKFLDPESGDLGPQQCGIASTLEADSAWFESFKPAEGVPSLRRGFAFAALNHPEGGLIMCYSVHLKSNGGSDTPAGEKNVAVTRAEAVRQLLAHKAEMEKKFAGRKIFGWVIAGDMNTNHDGQFPMCTAIKDLVAGGFHNSWSETPKAQRMTWRNRPDDQRFKPTTFDYVMTSGLKKNQATMVQGVPVELSDHAPILLELLQE